MFHSVRVRSNKQRSFYSRVYGRLKTEFSYLPLAFFDGFKVIRSKRLLCGDKMHKPGNVERT